MASPPCTTDSRTPSTRSIRIETIQNACFGNTSRNETSAIFDYRGRLLLLARPQVLRQDATGGHGVDAPVTREAGHALRVDLNGSRFKASLNVANLLEFEDSSFTESEHLGLWTKP